MTKEALFEKTEIESQLQCIIDNLPSDERPKFLAYSVELINKVQRMIELDRTRVAEVLSSSNAEEKVNYLRTIIHRVINLWREEVKRKEAHERYQVFMRSRGKRSKSVGEFDMQEFLVLERLMNEQGLKIGGDGRHGSRVLVQGAEGRTDSWGRVKGVTILCRLLTDMDSTPGGTLQQTCHVAPHSIIRVEN